MVLWQNAYVRMGCSCENPSFLGALNAFKSNGAKISWG